MAEINKLKLVQLAEFANKNNKDDLSYLGMDIGNESQNRIAEQIKRAMETRQQILEQESAEHVIAVLEKTAGEIEKMVDYIRDQRRAVEKKLSVLKKIELAREYGLETMNFLPLLDLLDSLNRSSNEVPVYNKVPDDWVSKKVKAQNTATKPPKTVSK